MVFLTYQDNEQKVISHFDNLQDEGVGFETTGNKIVWPVTLEERYFTLSAMEDGAFKFSGSTAGNQLQYSLNGGNWTTLSHDTNVSVSAGDAVLLRASGLSVSSSYGIGKFVTTIECKVLGNIMSLLYGGDFAGKDSLSGQSYIFRGLFADCTGIVDASDLIMPAKQVTDGAYCYMFSGCTNLTSAPVLPAMTLANSAYSHMFHGCSNLTEAPVLPATTLGNSCYAGMFRGCANIVNLPSDYLPATALTPGCYTSMFSECTSLRTAPVLPAPILVEDCYYQMFFMCSSLSSLTCLATDILATGCTTQWLASVSSTGSFNHSPNMYCWPRGTHGIPTGWNSNTEVGYAGTLVFSKNSQLYYCWYEDYVASDWTGYIKEGVIVAPGSHFTDGKARMISITGVTDTAGTAGNRTAMQFGATSTTQTNYSGFIGWNNDLSNPTYVYSGRTFNPCNSIDSTWSGATCASDPATRLYGSTATTSSGKTGFSMYLTDGSLNPHFRSGTTSNAFSDEDGSVTTASSSSYSAKCACYNFKNGNNGGMFATAGKWYLPAMGELIYILPRLYEINAAITKLGGKILLTGSSYWSNTRTNSLNRGTLSTSNGQAYILHSITNTLYVLPFTKVDVP